MTAADVIVVGGGPAGAAVAWQLATAGAAVTLVHDHRERWRPVGQQLSPAARPILAAMGVLDDVAAESAPVHEYRSAWPGPELDCRPTILSPFGPPLAVDRTRLDALLRATAQQAGVHLVHARTTAGQARVLVDATGAGRSVSRTRLPWTCVDRLCCAVWQASPAESAPQPWSLVEAAGDGWWYTAPTPAGDRLTVLRAGDPPGTNAAPKPPTHTARRLGRPLPAAAGHRVAVIGYAKSPWAQDLVAVGDAAVSVDPLSSSGLCNALRLAGPAATAILGLLDGDTGPAHRYTEIVHTIAIEHLEERRLYLTIAGLRTQRPTSQGGPRPASRR